VGVSDVSRGDLDSLLEFVRNSRGFDFTAYKRPSLTRRIDKRLETVGAVSYDDYRKFLERHPEEYEHLFNTILINVTGFFRDPEAWDYLATDVLPEIVGSQQGDAIRVWSTGCATGEEAFTLTMLLAELLGEKNLADRLKVYATDIDDDALGKARHAFFSAKQVEPVPKEYLEKYFDPQNGDYVFRPEIRRAVIFGRHDLIVDPPISRISLILARNTRMYFTPETQARVLRNFHFALRENGYLFLGRSEMLLTRSSLFVPSDLKRRVFRPTKHVTFRDRLLDLMHEPSEEPAHAPKAPPAEASFDAAPVAQIAVDHKGVLVLANQQARRLFGIRTDDVGHPFAELELSYKPVELRSPIKDAIEGATPTELHGVAYRQGTQLKYLDVHVAPIASQHGSPRGCAVTFTDVTEYRLLADSVESAKSALEGAFQELQATSEELETANEELQSTNEELETTNEELQSTNEELETMNEELQSTNEQLSTINDELRERTDELNELTAFMESVLSSLRAGVAVLDLDLRVQAWNGFAEDLWGVRSQEVQGVPFLNLDIGLPLEPLASPLHAALRDGDTPESIVLEAVNRRGKAIECKVSFTKLTTPERKLSGVLVLMEAGGGTS
jgi:two-component system, chemotaxis family, CheB/CheR fusion protein